MGGHAEVQIVRASAPLLGLPLGNKKHFVGCHVGVVGATKEFQEKLIDFFTVDDYYSPQAVCNAFNAAMVSTCAAATPVVLPADVPVLSVSASGLSLAMTTAFTTAGWRVGFNDISYAVLGAGWNTRSNIRPAELLQYVLSDGATGLQNFSTLGSLYMNKEIVITSGTIPIVGEVNSGNTASYNLCVLTEYDVSAVNFRQNVVVIPQTERWAARRQISALKCMHVMLSGS